MTVFDIKNLYYSYDKEKDVISDISFSVEEKDFVAIIGKNGSGKSTLINHLNGILKAKSGDIYFKGQNIYDKKFDLTKLRFKCGVVFQYPEYQLFSETVIEDVSFGAIKKGLSKEEAYKKSEEILSRLGILYLKNESPFSLSGGEKRKVAIAGVLVMEPEVLVLDEPDVGLDSSFKSELFLMLKTLNAEKNITIIFISHNMDDIVEYADKILVINQGKKIAYDTPYNIFSNSQVVNSADIILPYSMEILNKIQYKPKNHENIKFNNIVDILYNEFAKSNYKTNTNNNF